MLHVSLYFMFTWGTFAFIISFIHRRVLSNISNGFEIQILTLIFYMWDKNL